MSFQLFFQLFFIAAAVSKYVIFNIVFQNLQMCFFLIFAFVTHCAIFRIAVLKLKIIFIIISLSFISEILMLCFVYSSNVGEIYGSHSGACEDYCLLECDTVVR